MNVVLFAVPVVPILAAFIVLFLGSRLPSKGAWLNAGASGLSLLLVLILTGQRLSVSGTWLETGSFTLTAGLTLDPLSYLLALIVSSVSLLVGVYAVGYMAEAADKTRFFALLSFFVGAMLTLVLSGSFVLLFAAWEGVGLASYGLIGFWYSQEDSRKAARKAFLMTRLGDLGLLLGWLWLLLEVGTTDISAILGALETLPNGLLTATALLLLLGALGKSAQLPLTAWLPDAMAGPTPVSALIHSATMVAAGVYLLLRLFPLFEAAPGALTVILIVGVLTALFAALIATTETDLKRVLAWSTVSQLGEMMLALGVGGATAAAFHLTTHAAFKATLFLAAGAVGHAVGGYDLRKIGGLFRQLPYTTFAFGAAALTLAGLPPFSAFWSEEAILAQAASTSPLLGALLVLLIFLAGVYISRAGMAAFASWQDAPQDTHEVTAEEVDWRMKAGMLTTALFALGLGWALSGRLEAFLPFEGAPHVSAAWTLWAIAASFAGLMLGAWRVWQAGPVPTFGTFPVSLAEGLERVTRAPALAAERIASAVDAAEQGLDTAMRRLADAAQRSGQVLDGLETIFDKSARAGAALTLNLANRTDQAERVGFSRGGDAFARLLGRSGEYLRAAQSGKLYIYTLILFIWTGAVILAGALLWF